MLPRWEDNKPFALGLLILIAFAVLFLWAKTDNVIRSTAEIGRSVPSEHIITVEGVGKAIGKPDIASVSFGVDSRGKDVATAQNMNSEQMTKILDAVKALGISSDDIQTANYNVWQETIYNPDTQTSEPGDWIVSNSVAVKVRDTGKIASVLQIAGQNGATSISGPTFTIDDTTAIKAEAREKAIKDAETKAAELARKLGVRFERIVGYSEYTPDQYPQPYALMASRSVDMSMAPPVEVGTNEVTLNVSITYKLVE